MEEILTILISAFAGFIFALISDPVKNFIQDKKIKDGIRLSLFKEMLTNYRFLKLAQKEDKPTIAFALNHVLSSNYYNYVLTNELEKFYSLDESTEIRLVYTFLEIVRDSVKSENEKSIIENATSYIEHFEENIKDGTFKKERMKKYSREKFYNKDLESLYPKT